MQWSVAIPVQFNMVAKLSWWLWAPSKKILTRTPVFNDDLAKLNWLFRPPLFRGPQTLTNPKPQKDVAEVQGFSLPGPVLLLLGTPV